MSPTCWWWITVWWAVLLRCLLVCLFVSCRGWLSWGSSWLRCRRKPSVTFTCLWNSSGTISIRRSTHCRSPRHSSPTHSSQSSAVVMVLLSLCLLFPVVRYCCWSPVFLCNCVCLSANITVKQLQLRYETFRIDRQSCLWLWSRA